MRTHMHMQALHDARDLTDIHIGVGNWASLRAKFKIRFAVR